MRLGAPIRPSLRYRGQFVIPDLQQLTIREFIVTLIASMCCVMLFEYVFCLFWITVRRFYWRKTNRLLAADRAVRREIFSVEDIYLIIQTEILFY